MPAIVATVALIAAVPVPASALTVDEARTQIQQIVQAADNYNQTVLNQFAQAATSATTVDQLDAAYSTGYNSLEARWYQANADIDAILDVFPELQSFAAGQEAKLLQDHNAAHAEMDGLYDLVRDSLENPTTTTTTTISTTSTSTTSTSTTSTSTTSTTSTTVPTTTSTVARTTTTVPTTTTTSTRDTSTTTSSTSSTTTTIATTTTTTPVAADGGIAGGDGSSGPTVGEDPAGSGELAFADDGTVMNDSVKAMMDDSMQDRAPAMARVVETASIVLPPGIVEAAARPLIAIEFIVRAFFDSVGTMLLPLITLLMAVAFVMWRESRRLRTAEG